MRAAACVVRSRWQLERATWQHDIGVTAEQVVFIESPTRRLGGVGGDDAGGGVGGEGGGSEDGDVTVTATVDRR